MLTGGVRRLELTPFRGVELTGWGYYIERRWRRIHDPLYATAVAFENDGAAAIVIALDLMVIDAAFTRRVRDLVRQETGVAPHSVLVTCSHSHNAPAAGGLRGVGECDPVYEQWAGRQAATAAILAWQNREPVSIRSGASRLSGLTFNRTRADGDVDAALTVAHVLRADDSSMAVLVNFGAHPTVTTELRPWDVSRDVPGEVCSLVEAAVSGTTCVYIQGACGDVNFLREYQNENQCHLPAQMIAAGVTDLLHASRPGSTEAVRATSTVAELPTRRWLMEEIESDRAEAMRRLATDDISDWRATIGRSMTNRPDDMVTRHGGDELRAVRAMCRFHLEWTTEIMRDLETRPEVLETEVQALRVGDLNIVANSCEMFSPLALDVRDRLDVPALMIACYSNGRIGYLPDAHDIDARTYAGYQSPKYCNQFPFVHASGPAMCDAMVNAVKACQ